MKEAQFVSRHIEKWRKAEMLLGDRLFATPDELVDAYNEVTSDLAFSQTHFPESAVTPYLNDLALALHRDLYRNKRDPWMRLVTFWTHEVPLSVYEARRPLLVSLAVFVAFIIIGMLSTLGDPDFPRLILGDGYVDMTLDNIEKGEPMAVYGGDSQLLSFLGITINNVKVAFLTFVMGIFTSFGTCYFLMNNGIMVGAFVTFFINDS